MKTYDATSPQVLLPPSTLAEPQPDLHITRPREQPAVAAPRPLNATVARLVAATPPLSESMLEQLAPMMAGGLTH